MPQRLIAFTLAIFLSTEVVTAGPFEDGYTAYYEHDDFATAVRLWTPLAEQGDGRAAIMLDRVANRVDWLKQLTATTKRLYDEGHSAYRRGDYTTAHKIWHPLGLTPSYEQGWAAYQSLDFATAYKIFRSLSEQGDANAQNGLALLYYNGRGVPKDFVLAYMWANLSVAANWPYSSSGHFARGSNARDEPRPNWGGSAPFTRMEAGAEIGLRCHD